MTVGKFLTHHSVFLAAAHGISRPPPVVVINGPGHVASGVSAAFGTKALRAPAGAARILEVSFFEADGEGPASEVIAPPLLRVVMRVGLEALVIGATEILRLPGAARIGVPVASVVSASMEEVVFISSPPGDVAG